MEAESLAEGEQGRPRLFRNWDCQASMPRVHGLVMTGHTEVYTIEAEGRAG